MNISRVVDLLEGFRSLRTRDDHRSLYCHFKDFAFSVGPSSSSRYTNLDRYHD